MVLLGYGGKILRIDLTNGTVVSRTTPDDLVRDYIGGRGFVARLLWDEVPRGTAPLSADNAVIMASGPLVGVFVPGGRKDPLRDEIPEHRRLR